MLFDAMWFIVLCHVTWCKRCHVMCAHVMSCHLLCPAMGWNATSLRGHWLWGPVVWFEVVLWRCGVPKYYSVLLCTTPVLVCTTKYYPELLRNTKYYKVLLQYYSVLQSTAPVLTCTTTYYSTTPVLLCTAKKRSWLILLTPETSFTMRRATGLTLQRHQIVRLPCKITLMIDPADIWNVIYKAQTPVLWGYFSRFGDAFCIENCNILHSGYLPTFHRMLRLPRKVALRHTQMLRLPPEVTLQDHQTLRLPRKVTVRHHEMPRLPRKVTLKDHQLLRLPRKVILQDHQMLRLPRTELLLGGTVTSLNCYLTKPLLDWTAIGLLLDWTVTELFLDWTVTELLLDWAVIELLLDWTVTELSLDWAVTELILDWAVTLLSRYFTALLLYRTVTLLNSYFPELLLYWAVTLLNCYCTEVFVFFESPYITQKFLA